MLSSPTTSSFQSITPNPYALSPILCRPPKAGDALKVVSASFLSVLTKPSPNQKNRYKVKHTGDGGVFSDWQPMYEPSTIKADADRLVAHDKGVPHGADLGKFPDYQAVGKSFDGETERLVEKYGADAVIKILVTSQLHRDEEYGGPFWIVVPSKTRVYELRRVIASKCGVLPGLQRLTFAGKKMDDAERNLEHYGAFFFNSPRKLLPRWTLVTVTRTGNC